MQPVGYAVVGLGGISQQAVLPAFAHSKKARLIAVVSGDKSKAETLARQFQAESHYSYAEFGDCLKNPEVEAVYVATPPGEHEKYTVQAARAKKHVLCEKPLAATVDECRRMVSACRKAGVQLMTAYRKYFEPASVALKKIISSGDLGRLDIIHTAFSEFRPAGDSSPDWLFRRKLSGGGPLMDLGVYCVNTSRWLVGEDPVEAQGSELVSRSEAFQGSGGRDLLSSAISERPGVAGYVKLGIGADVLYPGSWREGMGFALAGVHVRRRPAIDG